VKDYASWKVAIDGHAGARAAAGMTVTGLWRNNADPDEVVFVARLADLAKAQEFLASDNLKQTMAAAGVMGRPDVTILNEA